MELLTILLEIGQGLAGLGAGAAAIGAGIGVGRIGSSALEASRNELTKAIVAAWCISRRTCATEAGRIGSQDAALHQMACACGRR